MEIHEFDETKKKRTKMKTEKKKESIKLKSS